MPEDFGVPEELSTGQFRLEPLGPQHNEADYAAWTASTGHIRSTPGFAKSGARSGCVWNRIFMMVSVTGRPHSYNGNVRAGRGRRGGLCWPLVRLPAAG